MRSARRGEVRAHIDAPPQKVWALLADLEQMGRWSPECYRVQWLEGASSPATPGARFQGWNRFGWMRWSMTCQVKTAEPGRELAFSTIQRERELVRWRYRLEPAGDGTDVIESFQVIWLPFTARLAEDVLMRDRDRRREDAMRATLNRIKDLAEGGAAPADRPGGTAAPHA
ncbi:MAG: SRPBCC family protein [Micromonosporaceae bacterium]